jgi:YfiH family protein
MSELKSTLITIPRFNQIPFLQHGFGDAGWKAGDFKKRGGWEDFRLLSLKQVHSDIVRFIRRVPRAGVKGDAAVTDIRRVFLIIKTADCLPVLLVDEKKRVIAAVHCGWKGTLRGLLEKVVEGMKARYACDAASILAAFGPCISRRCYEVGPEVRRSYVAAGFPTSLFQPVPGRPGKYYFDLAAANRLQLLRQGIKPKNIFTVNICTHCGARYPSYRRDQDATGRMLSFIGMSF